VQLLHPAFKAVTIEEAYDGAHRRRHDGRPWVVMSMISSADGATALDGSSGALGDETDKAVFLHLHRTADVVLVGAETVRRDGYSPLPANQTLVVVSASGNLGPRGKALLDAGNTRVCEGDVKAIVGELPGEVCVLEGGPGLNGQMLAADLVDEVCLTLAPRFVAGRSLRVAEGTFAARDPWQLAHVGQCNGYLFLRYLR